MSYFEVICPNCGQHYMFGIVGTAQIGDKHECEKPKPDQNKMTMLHPKRDLVLLMHEISEDCYCAGWMMGLEERLWHIIKENRPQGYGQGLISRRLIDKLKRLSEQAGGWFYVAETGDGVKFISLDRWERKLGHKEGQTRQACG